MPPDGGTPPPGTDEEGPGGPGDEEAGGWLCVAAVGPRGAGWEEHRGHQRVAEEHGVGGGARLRGLLVNWTIAKSIC